MFKVASFLLGSCFLTHLAQAEIRGLYQADCLAVKEEGLSLLRQANFETSQLQQTQLIYADLECSLAAYSFIHTGSYTLAADGKLDQTTDSIVLTPLENNVAKFFNQARLCGFDNWELNKGKNVSGLNCGGSVMPSQGMQSFDLIKEQEDSIVFGAYTDELDGSTAEKRPIEIDQQSIYKKLSSK